VTAVEAEGSILINISSDLSNEMIVVLKFLRCEIVKLRMQHKIMVVNM